MKTLNTIKKGCGKGFEIYGDEYFLCGHKLKVSQDIILCPSCQALLKQTEEIIILLKKEFGKKDFLWAVNTESPREVKDRAYKIINKLIGEEKK